MAPCAAWRSCFTGQACDCRSGGHAFCAPRVAEGASALRILECARLRIKDVDFHWGILTLQDTKGGNGRVTMLPDAAREALREQIKFARAFYDADRAAGVPGVHLPNAMAYKAASLATSWPWFWVLTRSPRELALRASFQLVCLAPPSALGSHPR